jgi:hypothetical protein
VKRSQVAGLAAGWLAIALSMAAIGAAAVSRVGVDVTESQVQITVARPTRDVQAAWTPAPAADTFNISPAARPNVPTVSFAQYTKAVTPARTTVAPVAAKSVVATPAAPSSTVTAAPVVAVPNSAVVDTEDGSTTTPPVPSTTPTTKPGKDSTKHHSSGNTASGSGSTAVVATSLSVWKEAEGAIRAGCMGTELTFVEAKPSQGYEASQRTSWVRTAVTFKGPTKVSVGVSCSGGEPSFSILD